MVKRYNEFSKRWKDNTNMIEEEDGEWVRWEDVEDVIEEAQVLIALVNRCSDTEYNRGGEIAWQIGQLENALNDV